MPIQLESVGLDGNQARNAMLQSPDGHGQLELCEYIHHDAIETGPTQPSEIGLHRVAFSVEDITRPSRLPRNAGCYPLRGGGPTRYKLTRICGPSGIIVVLVQELTEAAVAGDRVRWRACRAGRTPTRDCPSR